MHKGQDQVNFVEVYIKNKSRISKIYAFFHKKKNLTANDTFFCKCSVLIYLFMFLFSSADFLQN